MPKSSEKDSAREDRIIMEIVVDAYGADERAMGWYCYLESTLNFPFIAGCAQKRAISPLKAKDKVEVIGMTPSDECYREMFVTIRWDEEELAVPLSQLKVVDADEQTGQAVEDWHYWVKQGYEF
jgi:Calcium binding